MARITNEIADKYYTRTNSGAYFSLKDDGDSACVQFLFDDIEEIPVFSVHEVYDGDKRRYVNCLREPEDSVDVCPLCAAGKITKIVRYVIMYNHDTEKVEIWERGKRFLDQLIAMINRYSPLSNRCFYIDRHGKAGDKKTSYSVLPAPPEDATPIDIENLEQGVGQPQILGSAVMDLTFDEMRKYVGNDEQVEKPEIRRRGNGNGNAGVTNRRRSGGSEVF